MNDNRPNSLHLGSAFNSPTHNPTLFLVKEYDFCLAWNWEYDSDFVGLLAGACRRQGLSLLQVTAANVADVCRALSQGEVSFRAFFDRASDAEAQFVPVARWAQAQGVYRINPRERARRAWDKATMHLDMLAAGLNPPYTIILPPFERQPELPDTDLTLLGTPFTIKPAHGGGGKGVVLAATRWEQALAARQAFPADYYLLQAHVTPVALDGRPAWFRVLYCGGQVYPCWWNPATHLYRPLSGTAEVLYQLAPLREVTAAIAAACGLELFSTEIALVADGRFVVVDYVNDPIDLRLQSKTVQGVPDVLVYRVAENLVTLAATHCRTNLAQEAVL